MEIGFQVASGALKKLVPREDLKVRKESGSWWIHTLSGFTLHMKIENGKECGFISLQVDFSPHPTRAGKRIKPRNGGFLIR